jgi:hypothetical protein
LAIGDKRQAEECFAAAIDVDDWHDEACIDARYELAQMYELAREEREAYILVSEAMILQEARQEEDEDDPVNSDSDTKSQSGTELDAEREKKKRLKRRREVVKKLKFPRKPRLANTGVKKARRPRLFAQSEELRKQEEQRAAELAAEWNVVCQCREQAGADSQLPSPEFMSAAKALIDDFASFKDFYTWEKYLTRLGLDQSDKNDVTRNTNLKAMASRLSHSKLRHLQDENWAGGADFCCQVSRPTRQGAKDRSASGKSQAIVIFPSTSGLTCSSSTPWAWRKRKDTQKRTRLSKQLAMQLCFPIPKKTCFSFTSPGQVSRVACI